MSVYTLKKYENLDHLHLFEGEITQTKPLRKCTSAADSCCGNINKTEYVFIANEFACKPARDTLIKCISTKSPICSACEAHVFRKYQEIDRN
jgi:hypothetical protein